MSRKKCNVEVPEGFKWCGKCEEVKLFNEFHTSKANKNGCSSYCKECSKLIYNELPKDILSLRKERAKIYAVNNKSVLHEKYLVKNLFRNRRNGNYKNLSFEEIANRRKEKDKEYYRNNKDKNYLRGQKRRARKNNVPHKKYNRKDILKQFDNKCFKCQSVENLHIDHIVPIYSGGHDADYNLCVLCKTCNSIKNAKCPTIFYTEQEFENLVKIKLNR